MIPNRKDQAQEKVFTASFSHHVSEWMMGGRKKNLRDVFQLFILLFLGVFRFREAENHDVPPHTFFLNAKFPTINDPEVSKIWIPTSSFSVINFILLSSALSCANQQTEVE